MNDNIFMSLVAWADAIIPAASSFWSRIRGKFDIAHQLCWTLHQTTNKPLLSAPWHLHWRQHKRAHLNPALRKHKPLIFERFMTVAEPVKTRYNPDINALIVDDIVTTGTTLLEIKSGLPFKQIKFFAIADART